jgi:hypothetical protein
MHYPEKDEIKQAMDIGKNSIEGAKYLNQRVKERYEKSPISEDERRALFNKLDEYTQLVECRLSSAERYWDGEPRAETDFINMQRNIAKIESKSLNDVIKGTLRMDIAVNKQSEFLRGYSIDGNPLDPKAQFSLDRLYNSWLAEENIMCQGGIYYESTSNGDIKQDKLGNQITVDPDKVEKLSQKYENFLNKQQIEGLERVVIVQQKYPEPVSVEKEVTIKEVLRKEVAPEQSLEEQAEITPEAPGAKI